MHFASSLQTVANRINALDARLAVTRCATCVGFLMRGFFAFYPQLPYFVAPKIDQMSSRALAVVMVEHGGGSDSSMPAVEEGEGQMNQPA